ncbi:TPA: hypothetical protein RPW15_000726 [Campylobacter fetus subsp. venerealis]|uniref:Uncharacterized protein n=1 Tax=Campylobacter fetus subsp. venerealis NCTC 10354 TaxID=983328 RepID=A0AAE6IZS9_CAMFE|nr:MULTISPECIES: hypothetical protein [Campylobacter]OCS30501.1 hypothetical protein CFVLMG6570_08810 [Campylobacter fetus subsp. venerealis LMG 6570 = CCUG 33900]EAK0835612.1 hypothetical protein [Campylobacter fetus]EGU24525.1 hypothetical protein CFV354_1572 [Campylobacter fetus subsp. venerealis NCTC 10354]MBK3486719.1 hypothetical protein [Campylobacter fetus subsp. venerealis]MDV2490891.1 hypothetical protein [Campylobacter sp. TJR-1]
MNYIYTILGVLTVALLIYFNSVISKLELENTSLKSSLNTATLSNESYEKTLEILSSDYQKGLEVLANLKQEKQKEIRYVTQVKERIIKDNNSTCIDAINAIYARLHEQRDSNKQAIRDAKN